MENVNRYNHLNDYLKNKFGERVLKICVDGNFTCPNRDGKISSGGCIFCGERGAGEHLNCISIKSQVENYFNSYKAERANKFIVYFQNFSNTYDTVSNLKKKYDEALTSEKIVGIGIATRPDCINEDIVKLLKEYSKKYYVYVELGLQTSNNETGKLLNRGYTSEDFTRAVKMLNCYDIDVVAHIMVGLPGETIYDIENTVNFINAHILQGIKIHSTYIIKNTKLEELYNKKEYCPLSLEEYINISTYIISHLNRNLIIHRISGDAPKNLLVAPEWNLHKKWIINGINKKLRDENIFQGKFYNS